jgi:hypothetical protein
MNMWILFELFVAVLAYSTWDYNGIIGSGQSLSVGDSAPVVTTTQPFDNKKLSRSGKWPVSTTDSSLQLIPLVEEVNGDNNWFMTYLFLIFFL